MTNRFATAVFCVTAVMLLSISIVAQSKTQNDIQPATRGRQEDDIREAVIRYQMEGWMRDGDKNEKEAKDARDKLIAKQLNSRIFFVSVNGKDPSDEFLKRFQNIPRAIKKQSRVKPGLNRWVTDKDTNRNGIVFRADGIRWINESEVEVEGGYHCGSLCAAGDVFSLRLESGRWNVVQVRGKWIS